MGKLDGRVAIITGAGRGIGAEVAKAYATEGAKVVVNDLGVELDGSGGQAGPADDTVSAIKDAGGEAVANYSSVVDHNAAEGLVQQALDAYGKLDVLINVAGILRDRMVFNMGEEEWDAVIAVHLKGTFNTTKFASIYWRAERAGHYRLINFSSVSGIHGAPGQPNYAAAKLGIVGFTYSCANALSRYGVTSNAISPGAQTRMIDSVPGGMSMAGPEHVPAALIYIGGERSDWLNGQIIGARGSEVHLYNKYEMLRQAVGDRPWTVEAVAEEMEGVFRPAVEGTGFYGARAAAR